MRKWIKTLNLIVIQTHMINIIAQINFFEIFRYLVTESFTSYTNHIRCFLKPYEYRIQNYFKLSVCLSSMVHKFKINDNSDNGLRPEGII